MIPQRDDTPRLPPDLALVGYGGTPNAGRGMPRPALCRPRTPCPVCEAPIAPPGRSCEPCAPELDRRERTVQLDKVRATIPAAKRWATFASPLLARRVAGPPGDQHPIALVQRPRRTVRTVLLGPAGAGKTVLAVAMLQAILDRAGEPGPRPDRDYDFARGALFASAFQLAAARGQKPLGHGEAELVARALDASLLVLDDIGSERDLHGSAVRDVLWEREEQGRATVFTTWLDEEAAAARYDGGTARRIYDGATVIRVGGGS